MIWPPLPTDSSFFSQRQALFAWRGAAGLSFASRSRKNALRDIVGAPRSYRKKVMDHEKAGPIASGIAAITKFYGPRSWHPTSAP
jgi:hypothetical protein